MFNGTKPELFEQTISKLPSIKDIVYKKTTIDDSTKSLEGKGNYQLSDNSKQVLNNNTYRVLHNVQPTPLSNAFFSGTNIQNIQDLLKFNVHKKTNLVIDNQSVEELMIVMRYIYLQYGKHPEYFKKGIPIKNQPELRKKYTDELSRLNELTLKYILPKLVKEIQAHYNYLKDANSPMYIMENPVNDSIVGQRQYKSYI